MIVTKKEIKLFGDKKGNINIIALLAHKLGIEKSKTNDKYFREGRFDLIEWL